jgi:hypothetical protein
MRGARWLTLLLLANLPGCGLEPRYELDTGNALGSDDPGSDHSVTETLEDITDAGPRGRPANVEAMPGPPADTTSGGQPVSPAAASAERDGGTPSLCVPSVRSVAPEGAVHLDQGEPLHFLSNPPASGAHYATGAPYREYRGFVVERGYWLHNLELGGIAFLYGRAADASAIRALREAYDAVPLDPDCDTRRALLTLDPELDDVIAVVAWDHVLEASCVNAEAIVKFVIEHRGRGPEDVCDADDS